MFKKNIFKNILTQSSQRTMCYYHILCFPHAFSCFHDKNKQEGGIFAVGQLYECFMGKIRERGLVCEAGVFQAHIEVSYTNDGLVTIIPEPPRPC
jgi:hypothetical protein